MAVAVPLSSGAQAIPADRTIQEETIDPSETCLGITNGGPNDRHLAYAPQLSTEARSTLVVLLGGATSRPRDYTEISACAARMGYGVLNLSYESGSSTAGLTCAGYVPNQEACFTNYRGETIFGANYPYRLASGAVPASASWNHSTLNVSPENSIVNRLVCALQYLDRRAPAPGTLGLNNYFGQFLTSNSASPYPVQGYVQVIDDEEVTIRNRAYPDWSKIILVGHSTGSASAAFLSMYLPVDPPLKRVVLFSGPTDAVSTGSGPASQPAEWTYSVAVNGGASRTPLNRFWALRHVNEGKYGEFTQQSWITVGGYGIGEPGFYLEHLAGPGDDIPSSSSPGRFMLVIDAPNASTSSASSHLFNHSLTAADCYGFNQATCVLAHEKIKASWNYLISGGHVND